MDEELNAIKEVLKGNKQAYSYIINKYKNPLFSTILRMTKNPQDAQDLVQEAFLKVYRQLEKYDQKGKFSSWFYQVAINHCIDELRKKKHKITEVEIIENQIVHHSTPEIIFLKKENKRQLEKLIASLPEQDRLIILLRYGNELSYEEISNIIDLPLSHVRNKLHRAKKKMRKKMKEKGGNFHEMSGN